MNLRIFPSFPEDEYDSDDVEDLDEAADETKEKKMETVQEWERLNESKAIWLRNPSEVDEEEYKNFFKSLSRVSRIL